MPDFVKLMKIAALQAVEASAPMQIRYGTVISVSPLKIQLSQKMILDFRFLIIGENFTKRTYWTTIDGNLQRVTIDNSLGLGDVVVLLRDQGGQKFMVHDRIRKSSKLRLVGSKAENDVMIEELRKLTNQGLDYIQISGEVILNGKPNNEDKVLPIGTELIASLINGYKEVRISNWTDDKKEWCIADNMDFKTPNNATAYLELAEDTTDEPLKIRIAHELIHGLRITRGESLYDPNKKRYEQLMGYYFYEHAEFDTPFDASREELETTGIPYYYESTAKKSNPPDVPEKDITENAIRNEHDLPERKEYKY